MATIELVIKIPEEVLDYFAKHNCMSDDGWFSHSTQLLNAFRKGTPIPKGHGRLKDVDWIDDNCEDHHSDKDGSWCYAWRDIDSAPTIIEADKESENKR